MFLTHVVEGVAQNLICSNGEISYSISLFSFKLDICGNAINMRAICAEPLMTDPILKFTV